MDTKTKGPRMRAKPARRGVTWSDDEVTHLFCVWSRPDFKILLGEKKRRTTLELGKIVEELKDAGFPRTIEEVRAKIKNLKGIYRNVKDTGNPHTFKYFAQVERILEPPKISVFGSDDEDGDGENYLELVPTPSVVTSIPSTMIRQLKMGENLIYTSPVGEQLNNQMVQVHPLGSPLEHDEHPLRIEFELMSSLDGFEPMKGAELPIEIENTPLLFPSHLSSAQEGGDEMENNNVVNLCLENALQLQDICIDANNYHFPVTLPETHTETETPVIVFSNEFLKENDPAGTNPEKCMQNNNASTMPSSSSEKIPKAGVSNKRKLSSPDLSQKRGKFQNISDRLTETVSKLFISSTNAIIEEMKASEERFMKLEEEKRIEEHKKEAEMFQQLIAAIKSSNAPSNKGTSATGETPIQSDISGNEQSHRNGGPPVIDFDPRPLAFDSLANKLSKLVQEQSKETEENLLEWERKMQRKETKHTEKLFHMLLSTLTGSSNCLQ